MQSSRPRVAEVLAQPANMGKSDQAASLFQAIEGKFGKLDILVNNVGTNLLTPSVAEADEGALGQAHRNEPEKCVPGKFHGLQTYEESAAAGKIINISSIAARKAARGMGIYCVAKAGLEMLTKVLAVELASDHIQVNAVAPCVVRTQFSQPFWTNESILQEILKTIPAGRIAEPDDVVGAVLFLASSLSDFITGEILNVDGGSMA